MIRLTDGGVYDVLHSLTSLLTEYLCLASVWLRRIIADPEQHNPSFVSRDCVCAAAQTVAAVLMRPVRRRL